MDKKTSTDLSEILKGRNVSEGVERRNQKPTSQKPPPPPPEKN